MQNKELTIRAAIIGAVGSIIVGLSSSYIALKMGALPWPTVFVALASFAFLRMLGNTTVNEINVTHTAMSAGGLVAGGLAFTIPGMWMSGCTHSPSFGSVLMVTLSGAIFGVLFTGMIRKYLIEEVNLQFPLGVAAAETLISSIEGGSKGLTLLVSFILAGAFAAVRDWTARIPSVVTWKALARKNIFIGFALYPMALGIGYIIGPIYTIAWFGGSIFSYLLAIPAIVYIFKMPADWALNFVKMLGIGMIIGGGIAIMLTALKKSKTKKFRIDLPWNRKITLLMVLIAFSLLPLSGYIPLIITLLLIPLAFIIAVVAGSVDGMTGVDPMEVLAILVVLALKLVWHPGSDLSMFLIAAFVAIVAGLAGDALQDMKAGYILRTTPEKQLISEFIGAIVGGVAAVAAIFVLHRAYGQMGPGTQFPAPQAFAVRTMIYGLKQPAVFLIGLLLGFILQLLSVPAMVIGIGVYLPMVLSIPVAIGGATRWIAEKAGWDISTGTAIAAGFLGGEGLSGILIGFLKLFVS